MTRERVSEIILVKVLDRNSLVNKKDAFETSSSGLN